MSLCPLELCLMSNAETTSEVDKLWYVLVLVSAIHSSYFPKVK